MIKSVKWLHENLHNDKLIIIDASLEAKKPRNCQITGARYFNLPGKFSDRASKFPNTMPSQAQFQTEARNIGINNDSILVIYDNVGIYSAPRVWFMFRSMGHQEVFVLNGGLPAWTQSGYPVENLADRYYTRGDFEAVFNNNSLKHTVDIQSNIKTNNAEVLDARSAGRFHGTLPEPRAELQSGCIPGSISLPFAEVLENGKYKSKKELSKIFDGSKPMIFTCGSGLTACITLLAAEIVNSESQKSIYDGSWTEWAIAHDLLVI